MTVNASFYIINNYTRVTLLCQHLSEFMSGVNIIVAALKRSLAQQLGEQDMSNHINPAATLVCLDAACDVRAGTVQNPN